MKKILLSFAILSGVMMICSSCSKEKAKECNCRLVWTNPNYTVSAAQNVVWAVNAGETCQKAETALSDEYAKYICTER